MKYFLSARSDVFRFYFLFQILQARFEGSQFCYKSSGANQGCQFLQKFCEKLIGLQERQKEVLEGVTSVMKITDYKTQVPFLSVSMGLYQNTS